MINNNEERHGVRLYFRHMYGKKPSLKEVDEILRTTHTVMRSPWCRCVFYRKSAPTVIRWKDCPLHNVGRFPRVRSDGLWLMATTEHGKIKYT